MAEFKSGDRVVKMSGAAAGKYGTVNSVREDGTLNVTFDGEHLPRYCDPMRCGQVAANAKFKVGDKVRWDFGGGTMTVVDMNGRDYLCRDASGQEVVYSEDKLVAANNVRNAEASEARKREQDMKASVQKLARVASRAAGVPATGTYKWTSDSIGWVDIRFPDEESAKEFNYYKAIYAMRDAKNAVPSWAWGISGFDAPERIGSTVRIGLGHFAT